MTPRAAAAAVVAATCLLAASPATAHAPFAGVGALWNGALHPFTVPVHLLAILSVGLLLGQNAPRLSRLGWPAFALACALALTLADFAWLPPALLLVSAAAGGLLIALGRPMIAVPMIVVVSSGVLVGLDVQQDGDASGLLARAGVVCGAVAGVTLAGGFAAALERPWQQIAVRAAGSWIAAACILVLTLEVSGN